MASSDAASLTEHFGSLVDPRIDRTKRHKLIDILTIALCGASRRGQLGGRGSVRRTQGGMAAQVLELPNGIPSHDTFGRVFAMLTLSSSSAVSPSGCWLSVKSCKVTSLDGKTVSQTDT